MNHFRFTIPGQPPSWNQSYRHRTIEVDGRRVSRLFKDKSVKTWQDDVTMIVRAAKPSTFAPKNKIIVGYQMYLGVRLDADNVMKMLNDAIARGLKVNDSRFLPVTLHHQTNSPDPRLVVLVFDADFWFPTICANTPEAPVAEM